MKIQHRVLILTQILILIPLAFLFSYASSIYVKTYPNYVHKTLYVERNFNEEEVAIITKAAISWTESTHHIAEIDVVTLPTKEKIDLVNGIIMLKENADYPEIIILDGFNGDSTVGYCNRRASIPYIAIVSDRIEDPDEYQAVVMHEVGHALGLEHQTGIEGMDTLMYPSVNIGSYTITKKDLKQFCSLYHCDVTKL